MVVNLLQGMEETHAGLLLAVRSINAKQRIEEIFLLTRIHGGH